MEEFDDDIEDTSFTCHIASESDREWVRERKAARFFVKARVGILVGMAKGKRFRWWTLTESNESIEAGIDFSHSWSMMRKWLARLDEKLEYCLVEHIQGDKTRRNWHVLTYGDNKLPAIGMREYWLDHFMSTITGLEEVKNPFKSAAYLAGYLGRDDKFQKARFSQNWVFPYWWEFGRFYKREKGIYVPDDQLVQMSLMTFEERRKASFWFDVFMDVKKYGWEELFKRNNEKWLNASGIKNNNDMRNKEMRTPVTHMQYELWDDVVDGAG